MGTDSDIDLDLTTERDVAMQDGTSQQREIADHGGGDLAVPRQVAITERGRKVVSNYREDVRDAQVVATTPPSMGQLIEQIWRQPNVLADSGLLRFLVRIYALFAIPIVAVLYCLVAAYTKPALGVTVTAILGLLAWMWFFS